MPIYRSKLFFSIIFLTSTVLLFGQNVPKENSPYSRYGLGNINSTEFAPLQSMGGIAAGYNNPYQLNLTNPASTAFLGYTSFETGGMAKLSVLSANNESTSNWSGNISHFALGFPLRNSLNKAFSREKSPVDYGMALGLMPYSLTGYDVESTSTLPNVGEVRYKYLGIGATYQAFLNASIKYKGFALGGHAGYLFGSGTNETAAYFNDLEYAFSNILRDEYNLNGFIWRLGIQHEFIIGKTPEDDAKTLLERPRLVLGVYGNSGSSIDIFGTSIAARANSYYTGSQLDTIIASSSIEEVINLPSEFGVGFTYSLLTDSDRRIKFGADFKAGQWSQYNNPLKEETFADSWRAAIGGEIVPNTNSYNRYTDLMRYRIGFYYGADPRVVNGEQLTNYGLTLGFGFPLKLPRGMPSFMNLGLEAGQLSAPNLLNETYYKLNIGFTLNDNTWFYKQKFN